MLVGMFMLVRALVLMAMAMIVVVAMRVCHNDAMQREKTRKSRKSR